MLKRRNKIALTPKELLRLEEIEKIAIDNFLQDADFYIGDYVEEQDLAEWLILTEKQ